MKKAAYFSLALGLTLAFACAKKPGTIEGKATLDGAATGNAGIAVTVSGIALTAVTDDSGTYAINGIPAGRYNLEATKEGYTPSPVSGVVVEAGKTLMGLDINLVKIPPPPPPVTAPVEPPKEVVNINTATVPQLCLLPGITKNLAKAIVAKRKKMRFDYLEDLRAVKGINKKVLARIKDLVVVEGETTMKPVEKAAVKKKVIHKAAKKKAARHKKKAASR